MSTRSPQPSASASAPGLRERKKQRTHQLISDTAIALFLTHGFDAVSVVDVAAAAEVSKPTLFRYFPSKEDLVLHRFADHVDDAARVVAGRPPGRSPLDAIEAHLLDGLHRGDPVTGLCDAPEVLAYHRLLYGTPSLAAGMYAYTRRSEEALAGALAETGADRLVARLAARQILAALRMLALDVYARIAAGAPASEVAPDAVADAGRAFALLRSGYGQHL